METEAQSAEDTWGEFLDDWRRAVPALVADIKRGFWVLDGAFAPHFGGDCAYPPLRDADDWP